VKVKRIIIIGTIYLVQGIQRHSNYIPEVLQCILVVSLSTLSSSYKVRAYRIKAAPSIPITAPNVSRRGTRVGAAPPVDPRVVEAPGASGAIGADVAVFGVEVELEGTPVLVMVPLVTPVESGTTEPLELVADSKPLLGLVLEGAVDDKLEEDG
jgi:hypothetical protein